MWLVLLLWIMGSALFLAGWCFGVIMARRRPEPPDGNPAGFCEACYLRQVEAQVAVEPPSPIPAVRPAH
jgi:hypothetical protein